MQSQHTTAPSPPRKLGLDDDRGGQPIGSLIRARLPLPGAVWDRVSVYEPTRPVKAPSPPRRAGTATREAHPVDAALARGPTCLVVLISRAPDGLDVSTEQSESFEECAILAVGRGRDAELQVDLVEGHGITSAEGFAHYASTRYLTCAAQGHALLGFVRFTMGHYVLLCTSREKAAVIGPHVVFEIRASTLHYLGDLAKGTSLPRDELRYRELFRQLDLSRGYFYSHTLDLTRRLPSLMTIVGLPKRDKYNWNAALAEPLDKLPLAKDFIVAIIRGCAMHSVLDFGHRPVSVVLVARCSKQYAGARYLKRGVNEDGHVANHVEVEQILIDEKSLTPDRRAGTFSSFVQVRGSVPVFWGHENAIKPKPAMTFDRTDNRYRATKKHFAELMADYGSPIFVLNLLKQKERKPREVYLSSKYKEALDNLREDMETPDEQLRYVEFDFRNRTDAAWNELTAIAEEALSMTGMYGCDIHNGVTSFQRGVLRSNCVDCVDRTNYGQFFIGLHVFSHQLASTGVVPEPCALAELPLLREQLLNLYMGLGDHIGRQYGGSETVGAGLFARGVGWDKLMGFRRFYINQFEDAERQRATNLFLGLYTPTEPACGIDGDLFRIPLKHSKQAVAPSGFGALRQRLKDAIGAKEEEVDYTRHVDLWDNIFDSDYYLHVRRHRYPAVPDFDINEYRKFLSERRAWRRQWRSQSTIYTPRSRTMATMGSPTPRGTSSTPEPAARTLDLTTPRLGASARRTPSRRGSAADITDVPRPGSATASKGATPPPAPLRMSSTPPPPSSTTTVKPVDPFGPAPDHVASAATTPKPETPMTPVSAATPPAAAGGDDDDPSVSSKTVSSDSDEAEPLERSSTQAGVAPAGTEKLGDAADDAPPRAAATPTEQPVIAVEGPTGGGARTPPRAMSTVDFASPDPKAPEDAPFPATATHAPSPASVRMLSRQRPSTDADLGILPFATHPESSYVSPRFARTRPVVQLAGEDIIEQVCSPGPRPPLIVPSSPAGVPIDGVSDADGALTSVPSTSVAGESQPWYSEAVRRHMTLLAATVRQPYTEAECALRREQRERFEHFASGAMLDGIPVCFVSIDSGALEREAEEGQKDREQSPYFCTSTQATVYPREEKPEENLMPEDPYDLMLRPANYLANLRRSDYLASEAALLELSNMHTVVEPSGTSDTAMVVLGFVLNGPCRRWSLEEIENALRQFQRAISAKPEKMEALISDLRAYLLFCGPQQRAGEYLFQALEAVDTAPLDSDRSYASRPTNRPSRAISNTPSSAGGGGGSDEGSPWRSSRALAEAAARGTHYAPDLLKFLKHRSVDERRFLKNFEFYALQCPSPAPISVFESYVNKSESQVASRVLTPFRPLMHTLATYSRSVIATADEFDRVVRHWHDLLIDGDHGVPRTDLVRYADELEVQCPRAFAFRSVFTGGQLIDWIVANEDALNIQLAESALFVRTTEREQSATVFASCLINAGVLHAVSFTAAVSRRTGILTEPGRFRESIERRGLYRFLCHEPRHVFQSASSLPAELGMDRSDPESVMVTSFTLCRAALQWLYDDSASTPQQVRAVCDQLLPFVAEFNMSALTREMRACLFVNLFNTLFCLIFSFYRHNPGTCIDVEVAFHTHYIVVGGMHFTLSDIKHGILRNNRPDPRMALCPFAPGDARLEFCLVDADPRWVLLLLDLADDHEIERVNAVTPIVPPDRQGEAVADSESSDEGEKQEPSVPDPAASKSNRGALETAQAATKTYRGPADHAENRPGTPSDASGRRGSATSTPVPQAAAPGGGRTTNAAVSVAPSHVATAVASGTSWWTRFRRRGEEFEVLRCSAVNFEDFENRVSGTTKQVVALLTTAYQYHDSRAQMVAASQSGLKAYASKVMSTLKAFPELGSSQNAVMAKLRDVQRLSAGASPV